MSFGLEKYISTVGTSTLARLDLTSMNAALMLDGASNSHSYSRQNRADNRKTRQELWLEGPLPTAALFSLAGANAVVLPQWKSSVESCNDVMAHVVAHSPGRGIGETVHAYRGYPLEQPAPPPAAEAASKSGTSTDAEPTAEEELSPFVPPVLKPARVLRSVATSDGATVDRILVPRAAQNIILIGLPGMQLA